MGAQWEHPREPTPWPGVGVLRQAPSKAQAPNAFGLMGWSWAPKRNRVSHFEGAQLDCQGYGTDLFLMHLKIFPAK